MCRSSHRRCRQSRRTLPSHRASSQSSIPRTPRCRHAPIVPWLACREGVFGSTSTTYSPTATAVMTILQIPPRTSNTAATDVKVRSPETNPMPRASTRAVTPIVIPGCACGIDEHPLWVKRKKSDSATMSARPSPRRYNQLHIRPHHQFGPLRWIGSIPMITRHGIEVEHVRIESAKSFADVRTALERNVPQLDPTLVKALTDGDVERANREKDQGPELFIFQVRDHGALLAIAGKARNALQYEIGNFLTATLMTRHRILAALYAPIRVVLYENDAGHGVFEYDQPSTTFEQVDDERVSAVARGLDAALERALLAAAE